MGLLQQAATRRRQLGSEMIRMILILSYTAWFSLPRKLSPHHDITAKLETFICKLAAQFGNIVSCSHALAISCTGVKVNWTSYEERLVQNVKYKRTYVFIGPLVQHL